MAGRTTLWWVIGATGNMGHFEQISAKLQKQFFEIYAGSMKILNVCLQENQELTVCTKSHSSCYNPDH